MVEVNDGFKDRSSPVRKLKLSVEITQQTGKSPTLMSSFKKILGI